MNNPLLLSVIIPVYNAGAYLRPCVESVLSLPVSAFEVLLVDDGSSDGSGELCDVLAAEHPDTVRVIHQPNGGVSAARNAGMALATGEWLWFVDADDLVSAPEAWQPPVDARADMLVLPFTWTEDGRTDRYEAHDGELPYNLWRCWFRRDVVMARSLRFVVGRRYAEDQEFILHFCLATPGQATEALPAPVYHYTMRPGSAMNRPGVKRRQAHDVAAVSLRFAWAALRRGALRRQWPWRQLRRLTKTLIITLQR